MHLVFTFWIFLATAIHESHTIERNINNNQPSDLVIKSSISSSETESQDDLLALPSGSNKLKKKEKSGGDSGEEKKTLAQQVAEGKYGLIQNELFLKPPKRPGIVSYEANSDIPNDTVHTLGGLTKKDIWLAESHLLVLTGGTFQPYEAEGTNAWRPIDIYKAPKRPVKIPTRPKVPPPFPVQLFEGGPLQILGTNFTRTINDTEKASTAMSPPEGYIPGSGPFFQTTYPDTTNTTSRKAPFGNPPYAPESLPTPIFALNNTNLPPDFASLPPGAVVLPPPNLTNVNDEDDPSIYYPPPYSFYYELDNSTKVPPGPLVPGLILAPPPDFFAPLEETTPTSALKSNTRFNSRPSSNKTDLERNNTRPDLNSNRYKPENIHKTSHPNHYNRPLFRARNRTTSRLQKPVGFQKGEVSNITSAHVVEEIHIEKTKDNTTPDPFLTYRENILTQKNRVLESTTKRVPVRIFITPAYPSSQNYETDTQTRDQKRLKQLYYFEETPKKYYLPISPSPKFEENPNDNHREVYGPPENINDEQIKDIFLQKIAQLTPPRTAEVSSKPNSFKSHIDQIKKQIQSFYKEQGTLINSRQRSRPIYQYSFEAVNYRRPNQQVTQGQRTPLYVNDNQHYTVEIQPSVEITTERPYPVTGGPFLATPVTTHNLRQSTARPNVEVYYAGQSGQLNENAFEQNVVPNTTPEHESMISSNGNHFHQRTAQAPISLEGDVLVNYLPQRPTPNPLAELIAVVPKRPNYPRQRPSDSQRNSNHPQQHQNYPQQKPNDDQQDPNYSQKESNYPQHPNYPQQGQNYLQRTSNYPQQDPHYPQQIPNYSQQGPNYFVENYPQQHPRYPQHSPTFSQQVPNFPQLPYFPQQRVTYFRRRPSYSQHSVNNQQNHAQETHQQQPGAAALQKRLQLQEPELYASEKQITNDRVHRDPPTSYVSYKLPGDEGAHFYFLTPQQAKQQRQGVTYYFEKNDDVGVK